jgi:hypothetical protein
MDRYLIPRTKAHKLWRSLPGSQFLKIALPLVDGTFALTDSQGFTVERAAAKCPVEKAEKELLGQIKTRYSEIKASFDGTPVAAILIELDRLDSGFCETTDYGKTSYAMREIGLLLTAVAPSAEFDACKVAQFDFEKKG